MKACNCVALVNKYTHEVDGIAYCTIHKAAPHLLEACKRVVRESSPNMSPTLSALEQCAAAIEKAEGGK